MEASLKNLKRIATAILSSETEDDMCRAVQRLVSFYNQFPFEDDNDDDIQLNYGYALSVKHAADCIKDYKRTVAFLKGIYQGMLRALEKFKGETINILYAGSGPYAPLVLPLLSLLGNNERFRATIIDINPTSVKSVKAIVKTLQLQSFIDGILVEDAISYQYPKTKKLHLVIAETMFHALTREPQVAVTENLNPQIIKGGYLIPQKIEVKLGCSFFSKEPFLNQCNDTYTISNGSQKRIRKNVVPLFELKNASNTAFTAYFFESNWMEFPNDIEDTPDLCVYTSVNIFKDINLKDSESLITNPYCLGAIYPLKEKGISRFKVRYSIEKKPSWQLII